MTLQLIVVYSIGQIKNISVQFRQAKDYPVDLYFLMDLSSSMWDDKENLERLGGELVRLNMWALDLISF